MPTCPAACMSLDVTLCGKSGEDVEIVGRALGHHSSRHIVRHAFGNIWKGSKLEQLSHKNLTFLVPDIFPVEP
jgi:hypothetical protein